MSKRGADQDIVVLLISTLITLASWVGFEVYRAYSQVPVPQGLERHLQPLDPTLSTNVLDILEKKNP